MIRRPPRSTLSSSSAASDVYKRQDYGPVIHAPAALDGSDPSMKRNATMGMLEGSAPQLALAAPGANNIVEEAAIDDAKQEARARVAQAFAEPGTEAANPAPVEKMQIIPVGRTGVNALALNQSKKLEPEWHAPWKLMRVISGHQGWVRAIAVDPGNEWFVTGASDCTIKCFDLASGTLKLTLTGHISCIRGLAVSATRPYMFSVAEDKTVKCLSLIHISEPTRLLSISYAVFCLKKKKTTLYKMDLLIVTSDINKRLL
eukprot:TRINITY_DN22589_c0_g1_i1.p1 TRINITY_DN22589_c0_g1~~TRINITY_DN22589_c0_g1_i1.p1  ORF type:complete len:259 (+),score=40.86 TRINITY_DN22589_c0_g1_i1:101-877(+)